MAATSLLTTFKINVRSGFAKLTDGKMNELTAEEKTHLGWVAGASLLTTIALVSYTYRSSSSSTSSTTTTTNDDVDGSKSSGTATMTGVCPADTPKSTSMPPTDIETPSTSNQLSNTNQGGESENPNVDEFKQKKSPAAPLRQQLAVSPSSEEELNNSGAANSSTADAAATPLSTRHMEFSASVTSTSESEEGEEEEEEEEEEERNLTLEEALTLIGELLEALDKYHDDSMVEVYGSFVSCLISMQKVFQRFDWGYAEWPDVIAVLDAHSATSPVYVEKWNELQKKLNTLGFPTIPIFKNDLTKDELLKVMYETLRASTEVAESVRRLKSTGDPVIDAHHEFNEKKTRETYEQWRRLCTVQEFFDIEEAAEFPDNNMVVVPKNKLKEWKDGYLVRIMLSMMTPLTKLQEDNMRKYGIGATQFQLQVWKHGGNPEVADVKHQLEFMMTQIHPTASDTETTDNSGSGSGSGSDSTY